MELSPPRLDVIDTAKVDPCPGCGVSVRRFSAVFIAEGIASGPWYCPACLKAKVVAALVAAGLRKAEPDGLE